MTIEISIGNVGSGKTASAVRDIAQSHIPVYSNIRTTFKHQKDIDASMILTDELNEKGKHDFGLNVDFWKNIKKPVDVILDEAHAIINSRRSMSKINIIVTDWLALIRRILGSSEDTGKLVLITQLPNRIDTIARDMATQVRYHICHYWKTCTNCSASWQEHSDMPEKIPICINCSSRTLRKHSFSIEVFKFQSMKYYYEFSMGFVGEKGKRPYYDHYFITDIENYFDKYDTFQWDSLFGQHYYRSK